MKRQGVIIGEKSLCSATGTTVTLLEVREGGWERTGKVTEKREFLKTSEL